MLTIKVQCIVAEDIRGRNIALSKGYPPPAGNGHLAVVGGGPSVGRYIEQLCAWPGDIWAINGAAQWCLKNGIDAFLYSVDPDACLADLCDGVERAVLASHCDPSAYEALKGKEVLQVDATGIPGPTSATGATVLAFNAGYRLVTFFGCESSFEVTTHVYQCEDVKNLMRVECGGEFYLTKPEYLLQAEQLAGVIRGAPEFFREVGGGLLAALVAHETYVVKDVSRHMVFEPV